MTKKSNLTQQSLTTSRFYGHLALAEEKALVPDEDPRMFRVLLETASDHTELMKHIREWHQGRAEALKIKNHLYIDERPLDLRQPLRPDPQREGPHPKAQPFRFKRH